MVDRRGRAKLAEDAPCLPGLSGDRTCRVGLTPACDDRVRDDLARGDLVAVLEEFSTPFPGLCLCYPQRRHISPALQALIEHLRTTPRT